MPLFAIVSQLTLAVDRLISWCILGEGIRGGGRKGIIKYGEKNIGPFILFAH